VQAVVPAFAYGIPTVWVGLDENKPPIFESQAAYLKRHGLLLAGEEQRVTCSFEDLALVCTLGRGSAKKEDESLMPTDTQLDFDAPATLRKWPSLKNARVSAALGARPYLVADGTLNECIRQYMSKPASQHHLYEIHTAPQGELITAVLSAEHIVEIARLRDFL
jgi:hypothetical protein